MKDHDANRHPGPWRVMSVDSETAGILVAVGFLAMGLVSIPVARWFVVGCLALGGAVAVLLRFTSRKFIRLIGRLTVGTLIILAAYALWRFVPLYAGAEPAALAQRAQRINIFCDAYGLADRRGLLDTIERRQHLPHLQWHDARSSKAACWPFWIRVSTANHYKKEAPS